MKFQELAAIPALGGLYAKGIGKSVPVVGGARPRGELVLPETGYRVDGVETAGMANRLRDYQALVREPASDVLPAGFLHVLAFPLATTVMVRPDFPLPLLGMVHLANDATVFAPVRIGDELTVSAWAENPRPHRRGAQVDLVAEIKRGGEVVYRGTSTYLAKGSPASFGFNNDDDAAKSVIAGSTRNLCTTDDEAALPVIPARGAQRHGPESPAQPNGLETTARTDWIPPHPTARWRLGAGMGRSYAAVSGDRNPIHMSALSAKAFGFPRAIAHGMYTAARALAEVGPARRGDAYRWLVEFAKPVLLPSTVEVSITRDAAGAYDYQGWTAPRRRADSEPKPPKLHFTGQVWPM